LNAIGIGSLVHVKGSRPQDRVWRIRSINERDRSYHVMPIGGGAGRDVLYGNVALLTEHVEHNCDCSMALSIAREELERLKAEIFQLTQERDRYFDRNAELRAELAFQRRSQALQRA
jgi:hypothetical protein